VATRFCSPALLNHSVRSYLWGVTYGIAHGIAFDDELYYVSALLHDIGPNRSGRSRQGSPVHDGTSSVAMEDNDYAPISLGSESPTPR
jgi:hypothetical protein